VGADPRRVTLSMGLSRGSELRETEGCLRHRVSFPIARPWSEGGEVGKSPRFALA
jgi:hypothetical protein